MEPIFSLKQPLSEYTANQIIDYIISTGLQSGDRLPNESDLGETLGVGRSTVREAIKILASQNIVEIMRGKGTYVANNPGVTEDPFGFRFVQDKRQLVLELQQLREIIEPAFAALAAQNASEAELHRMMEAELEMEACIQAGKDHSIADVKFHTEIAKCSHNHVVDLIFPVLTESIPTLIQYTHAALAVDAISDHRELIQAILAHNANQAREIMNRHLSRNRKYIMENVPVTEREDG